MGKRSRSTAPRISSGDLELLEILWRLGSASLAEAHRSMERQVGYTTVQTRLNRLVDKGLARRSTARPAIYEAAVPREQVMKQDLNTLVTQVNGGQIVPLVAHLVRDRSLTEEEIGELRSLIDEAARNARSGDSGAARKKTSKRQRSTEDKK